MPASALPTRSPGTSACAPSARRISTLLADTIIIYRAALLPEERRKRAASRLWDAAQVGFRRLSAPRGSSALVQGLNTIRADNNKKLDEIRGTVEEKLQDTLQQRINDSFKTVSAQLEQVYKGLGEMQNLAADVGSLKQVLSGVKTRGILGEVQLGAILEQILAPGQYACNVATVPGSTNRVEYAIKMPGQNGTVWLPIDAKFPGDTYAHLQAAQERGDAAAVAAMRKALNNVLRAEARDIHDKYIEVPYTTSFGILFLPFEGLYAEVVSSGVTELLQRDYQITVAGPSTMAALLNALQMGFRNPDDHRFLRTCAQRFGAVYSAPGTGICHQLHLENFGIKGPCIHCLDPGGIFPIADGDICFSFTEKFLRWILVIIRTACNRIQTVLGI